MARRSVVLSWVGRASSVFAVESGFWCLLVLAVPAIRCNSRRSGLQLLRFRCGATDRPRLSDDSRIYGTRSEFIYKGMTRWHRP
jgi:hypothetical protein